MRYYLFLKQRGEGCDYTIGCGSKLVELQVDSPATAASEARRLVQEEYTDDREVESATLLEAASVSEVDVAGCYRELAEAREARTCGEKERRDRAQFEMLKKRYGG